MPSAAQLRSSIEASLAHKIPAALTPVARLIRPLQATGIAQVDRLLGGGIPQGAITEIVGPLCSGRTTLAQSFLGRITQRGGLCAWVDVEDSLSPESAASNRIALDRLLWVRCSSRRPAAGSKPQPSSNETLSAARSALNKSFRPAPATSWNRLDQAIRAMDLLLQGGGFSALLLDCGGLSPEFVRRIPLATWYRWKVAAVHSHTSVVVLTQSVCAGPGAEVVLHLKATEPTETNTVMPGGSHRAEVVRRRFENEHPNIVPLRKPPQREQAWDSCSAAAGNCP